MEYNNKVELENYIQTLKLKQTLELDLLKQGMIHTVEGMEPLNILKRTLLEIVSNQKFKRKLINSAFLLGTSYLIEKAAPKKPLNTMTSLLASIIEFSLFKFREKI